MSTRYVVLHSGNVYQNDVNCDLLVSEWKRTLGERLSTVADYASHFTRWLASNQDLIAESSEGRLVESVLHDHYGFIRHAVLADGQVGDPQAALLKHARAGLEYLSGLPLFEGADDDMDATLIGGLETPHEDLINLYFGEFGLPPEVVAILRDSAALVLSRAQEMPGDSTLAFVGFGADEYFAQSVRLDLRGRYGRVPRVIVGQSFGYEIGGGGRLSQFAQSDAIMGFLTGAHAFLVNSLREFSAEWMVERLELEATGAFVEEFRQGFEEHFRSTAWEHFVDPMLSTIENLPLSGVAELAEALVGMQATRSASMDGPATVGGIIESLVISRAHGIQWVHQLPTAVRN